MIQLRVEDSKNARNDLCGWRHKRMDDWNNDVGKDLEKTLSPARVHHECTELAIDELLQTDQALVRLVFAESMAGKLKQIDRDA